MTASAWTPSLGTRAGCTSTRRRRTATRGAWDRGCASSGVPREEVFITTKFFPRRKDLVAEARRSLQRLGVDDVDLDIIHWPEGGPTWAWPGMEQARELGYARSIGVSNFDVDELRQLLATATVPPVVDQAQFSPYEYRRALLESCRQNGIALEAYSPLGTGRHLGSDKVARIARRHGRTPAQGCCAGASKPEHPGHPQVDPPRAHREKRAALPGGTARCGSWRAVETGSGREDGAAEEG